MNPSTLNASVKERLLSRIVELANLESVVEQKQKEIDRLNEVAMKESVKFERIKAGLFTLLEQTENRFDITGEFFCVEDAIEYVDIAQFCSIAFNRKKATIGQVQEWINEQSTEFDSRNLPD